MEYRLDRVLVADARDQGLYRLRAQLAVLGGDGQELHAGDRLRGAALIHVHMGRVGTDDRVPGPAGGAETEDVGPAAAPDGIGLRLRPEVLGETLVQPLCERIMTVAEGVALIGLRDRLQHLRVDGGRVIGGKSAADAHAAEISRGRYGEVV
jgi:hypothetical protein